MFIKQTDVQQNTLGFLRFKAQITWSYILTEPLSIWTKSWHTLYRCTEMHSSMPKKGLSVKIIISRLHDLARSFINKRKTCFLIIRRWSDRQTLHLPSLFNLGATSKTKTFFLVVNPLFLRKKLTSISQVYEFWYLCEYSE